MAKSTINKETESVKKTQTKNTENTELEGLKKTEQYLINLFKARFSFIYIQTWEELRVLELINKIAI